MAVLQAFHRAASDELAEARVSAASMWSDDVWEFPLTTAGQMKHQGVFDWRIPFDDGTVLTDERHRRLLEGWKRVVWSVYAEPGDGKLRKWESVNSISGGVRYLCRWMARNGVEDVTAMTRAVAQDYLTDLIADKTAGGDDDAGLSYRLLGRYVQPLGYIGWAAKALAACGFGQVSEDPLGGKTVRQFSRGMAAAIQGSIPAIPDAAFITIVNAAWRYIEENQAKLISINNKIAEFRLSNAGAHKRKLWMQARALCSDIPGDENLSELRYQSGALRTACCIMIQATTGIRVSELCGLEVATGASVSGLPSCIEIQRTDDDYYELFFIRGWLFKTAASREAVSWIAGMRPTGSSYVPPPVRAIQVLDLLDRGWRQMGSLTRLCVQFVHCVNGFPIKGENIATLFSPTALVNQQKWIKRHADLADYLRHERYTTHMWRKTFAQYMVRTAPGLLPTISDHFKHVTEAMTEKGYLQAKTGDLELNDLVRAERRQQAAQLMHEIAAGERLIAGPKAEQVRREAHAIISRLGNRPASEIRKDIEEIVQENDFKLWDSEFGYCVFAAEGPKCHSLAGPLGAWARRAPNLAERSPPRCVECPHFAVTGEHEAFWRRRLNDNRDKWEAAKHDGRIPPHLVAEFRERTRQAEIVLTWIEREKSSAP